MAALAVVPIALRVLLLADHPIPTPDVYDEFSHLLVADTLRHFRLANPPHALPRFFETLFVLQTPTYSSIYPIGQGLILAAGRAIFGTPWAGVLLSTGGFCALCYWMLRGWIPAGWALLGGIFAVFEFGPLNQWTNGYWGGGYTAAAGCLVFGALPRLRNRWRARDAALLGLGLAMHLLSRPYETIFLVLSVALYWLPELRQPMSRRPAAFRRLTRPAVTALLVCLPAIGVSLLQNRQVTGSWTTMPYSLSQYQYGIPASFTFQKHPEPHRQLTREQELDYRMQRAFRSTPEETLASYLERLAYRVRYYRFYLYAPLYLAMAVFLGGIRNYRHAWVVLTIVLFALGVNFFPIFNFHYIAAASCLFMLMSVEGLRRLGRMRMGSAAARVLIYLCIAQFVFAYSLHWFERQDFATAMRPYDVWDSINHNNPEQRIQIHRQIAGMPGKLLIFVRYWPQHIFQNEWVYNEADIDGARVVWARDLGDDEDAKLRQYYSGRVVLLLEPDARPPRLTAYRPEPPKPSAPPQPPEKNKKEVPKMPLEPVI